MSYPELETLSEELTRAEKRWKKKIGRRGLRKAADHPFASMAYHQLSRLAFAAGDFGKALHYFRIDRQHLDREIERQGAPSHLEFARSRSAWRVADREAFEAAVREDSTAPQKPVDLAYFPMISQRWAMVGWRPNGPAWDESLADARAAARDSLGELADGEALEAIQGVVVGEASSLTSFWLGRYPEARDAALEVLRGAEAWNALSPRPSTFGFDHEDLTVERARGLAALLAENSAHAESGDGPAGASRHFRKALVAAMNALEHEVDDLVFLHLISVAWSQPEDPLVAKFAGTWPHLRHLLDPERKVAEELSA